METLEIYYSEDTDPRFVTKDNGSVFLGSPKDNTVKLFKLLILACANKHTDINSIKSGYTCLEDEYALYWLQIIQYTLFTSNLFV